MPPITLDPLRNCCMHTTQCVHRRVSIVRILASLVPSSWHDVPMDIAALVISIVAVVAAIGNVVWTQTKADDREIKKWERDSVKTAVSGMLKESNKRANKSKHRTLTALELELLEDEIRGYAFDLKVIGAEDAYKTAEKVLDWHHTDRIRFRNQTPYENKQDRVLTNIHNELVLQSQKYTHSGKSRSKSKELKEISIKKMNKEINDKDSGNSVARTRNK